MSEIRLLCRLIQSTRTTMLRQAVERSTRSKPTTRREVFLLQQRRIEDTSLRDIEKARKSVNIYYQLTITETERCRVSVAVSMTDRKWHQYICIVCLQCVGSLRLVFSRWMEVKRHYTDEQAKLL